MDYNKPHKELRSAFTEFCSLTIDGRKSYLPKIEHIVSVIEITNTDGYISGKCSKLIEACKTMSLKRHPKTYNEEQEISWAIGYISLIQDNLSK